MGGQRDDRIEKRIEIAAPVARVWRALTDFREFGEWFQVTLEGPFVMGKTVGVQLTFPGYEHVRMEVHIQEIKPETYFSYTWHPHSVDPKVDYTKETPTLVEFRLEPAKAGTLLIVAESGFAKLPRDRQAQAFRMNTRGWEQQLQSIQSYVDQKH